MQPMRTNCLRAVLLAGFGVFALVIAPPAATGNAPASPPTLAWRDTGITLPPFDNDLCFDMSHPYTLLIAERGGGTTAYNWVTGQRTPLNSRPFDLCGPDGLLFAGNAARPGPPWRFSLDDPQGQAIALMPSTGAADGTRWVYSLNQQLSASPDGGLTWQQHDVPPGSNLVANSLVVAGTDGRVLYVQRQVPQGGQLTKTEFDNYFSSDGGATWQPRSSEGVFDFTDSINTPIIRLRTLAGRSVPIDLVLKESTRWRSMTLYGSADGARSFHRLDSDSSRAIYLAYTPAGLLRWQYDLTPGSATVREWTLSRSTDGGQHWQELPTPTQPTDAGISELVSTAVAPANVFLTNRRQLYYSSDSGQTWQQLPDYSGAVLRISPYLPLTLLYLAGNTDRLYTLEVPGAGQTLLGRVPATSAPQSVYFAQTGHNLGGNFLPYWESHGGLAQFGYPLTDEFAQVSPTDGRIYTMQYFERAVFERHPANAPPYDVLLSLLGAPAYQQRYGPAGAPNQHASTDHPRYFTETGHTLGGRFRQYWESHGGLAQQGYPLSDEFTEISALDGKPYTVQYFERAVFEYHPENNPPYDVLLSQLGAFQARSLGGATDYKASVLLANGTPRATIEDCGLLALYTGSVRLDASLGPTDTAANGHR